MWLEIVDFNAEFVGWRRYATQKFHGNWHMWTRSPSEVISPNSTLNSHDIKWNSLSRFISVFRFNYFWPGRVSSTNQTIAWRSTWLNFHYFWFQCHCGWHTRLYFNFQRIVIEARTILPLRFAHPSRCRLHHRRSFVHRILNDSMMCTYIPENRENERREEKKRNKLDFVSLETHDDHAHSHLTVNMSMKIFQSSLLICVVCGFRVFHDIAIIAVVVDGCWLRK